MTVTLPFTQSESTYLLELLEKDHRQLLQEEHRTDHLEFKQRLREKIALAEGLILRLTPHS